MLTPDEIAQEYEDAMWNEWPNRAIAAVVNTWSEEDIGLFETALQRIDAVRDEERDEIRDALLGT